METIKTYLDNMFARLPRTAQINELKANILINMEEKYQELKSQGKSENEAIGIVISEFGNIDELVNELGINTEEKQENARLVTSEQVKEYIAVKRSTGFQVATGVFLCILAVISLILTNALIEKEILTVPGPFGIVLFFIIIAIAVAILIRSGLNLESYKFMEEGVILPLQIEAEIKEQYKKYMPTFNLCVVIGVSIIILSLISLFVTSESSDFIQSIGVCVMLFIVDIAVVLFILSGNLKECYERLLNIGDYTPKKKEESKLIGAVASIVWPLAVIVFLVLGFVFHLWYICWIVFPITGILFGMFCAAYSTMAGNKEA